MLRDPVRRTMWASAAVATAATLPVFLTGALAVQMREEIGFDESGLGLTVAAYFGAAAVLSAAGGRVAERMGAAHATRASAASSALALLLIGLAPTFTLLLAALVVGGAANALAQPATSLLMSQRIPPERLGMAFGVKQSAIPMATLLGGLAVPTVALTVGWRWAFAGAALAALVLAWRDPGALDGGVVRRRGARRTAEDTGVRPLVLLGIGAGLGAAAAGTIGSFLVSAAVDSGIAEGTAGTLAFVCSAAGITTRVTAGARADRRGGGHLSVVATMLGTGTIGYVALASGSPALIVVGAFAGYCLGWGWPGLFHLAVVRNNPGAPGAATGIVQTGTYVGAVLGPLLFGFAVAAWGYGWAFLGSGLTSALAALAIVNARRALKLDQTRRAELVVEP